MLVHCGVTPSIKFAGTHLYTWVEGGTVRVKCIAQVHNIMSPVRARTWTALSKDKHTNHKATASPFPKTPTSLKVPLRSNSWYTVLYAIGLSYIPVQISIYYKHQNSHFWDLYFREFRAAISFPCSKSWWSFWENDAIFSKILHVLKL